MVFLKKKLRKIKRKTIQGTDVLRTEFFIRHHTKKLLNTFKNHRLANCNQGFIYKSLLQNKFSNAATLGEYIQPNGEDNEENRYFKPSIKQHRKPKQNEIKLRSFMSSEHINEKMDGPYRGFGYLSVFSDPLDLATWNQREQYCNFETFNRIVDTKT